MDANTSADNSRMVVPVYECLCHMEHLSSYNIISKELLSFLENSYSFSFKKIVMTYQEQLQM